MSEKDNKKMLALGGVIVASLLVILVSIIQLAIPASVVCIIVVIEAALAACLHDVPIWLHGLVLIGQLIAGVIVGQVIFIILCMIIYLISIFTLRFMRS